jgi:hypothetical protein
VAGGVCHICGMAVYKIVSDGQRTFRVEVEFPSGHLQVVAGFKSEEAAQAWIADRMREIAQSKARP